ncbi:MAG: hypothetical protein ACOZFS_13485 [Thermodesulfobacteriota bacterium]
MKRRKKWRYVGLITMSLAFALTGCAQPPDIIINDRLTYRQREELEMVPLPSAESTNQSLWMDMEGGGP